MAALHTNFSTKLPLISYFPVNKNHKRSSVCSVRYRYSRYRYGCRTELPQVSGTGIDIVPNLPKCLVPLLMSYLTYRSVHYRYWCRTELTDVSGTGIDFVPILWMCPVPVLMSSRNYRSVRYRYWCRTQLTGFSDAGITGGIDRRYASVRTVPNTLFVCCSKCTLWIIN